MWLKNDSSLTEKQKIKKESLSKLKLKTSRALAMRETLQEIYALTDKEEARKQFKRLIRWMKLSKLEPMISVGKMIDSHLDNILNYFDDRLTNATLEGINNIIQNVKGNAREFKNPEYFKAIIYLYCGDFEVEVLTKEKVDND